MARRPANKEPLTEAQQALVLQYRGLACKLALQYWNRNREAHGFTEYDDVEQAAQVGLVRAARLYDPANPTKASFMTYAWFVVKDQIKKHVHAQHQIQIPEHLQAAIRGAKAKARPAYVEQAKKVYFTKSLEALPVHPHEAAYQPDLGAGLDARIAVEKAFRYMTPRERQVMVWKHVEGRTLAEIGGYLGVSRERVRQVLKAAAERARRGLRAR